MAEKAQGSAEAGAVDAAALPADKGGPAGLARIGVLVLALALLALIGNEVYESWSAGPTGELARRAQRISPGAIDKALEGKPVYLNATVDTRANLADGDLGVSTNAVALHRLVEMYQWVELRDPGAGDAAPRYERQWDAHYHDSRGFVRSLEHRNPEPALSSVIRVAPDARLGPFLFDDESLVRRAFAERERASAEGRLGSWVQQLTALANPAERLRAQGWSQPEPGVFYRGRKTLGDPDLGDLRVRFFRLPTLQELSVVGIQKGERIVPLPAADGEPVWLVAVGFQSLDQLLGRFGGEQSPWHLWIRIGGLLLALLGALLMARRIAGGLVVVPGVAGLARAQPVVLAALFGLAAGATAIGIGWLTARNLVLGVAMVLLLVALVWTLLNLPSWLDARRQAAEQREAEALRRAAREEEAARAAARVPPRPAPSPPRAAKAEGEDKEIVELPDLEWTPGLLGELSAERKETPPAAVELSAEDVIHMDLPPARPVSAPVPAGSASPEKSSAAPKADRVAPADPQAAPAPVKLAQLPGFEVVETREQPMVGGRESTAAAPAQKPAQKSAPKPTELPGNAAANPGEKSADGAHAPVQRVALGSKGPYALFKILRLTAGGGTEVVCFELQKDGKPIKRGSQEQVKAALQQLLQGGG